MTSLLPRRTIAAAALAATAAAGLALVGRPAAGIPAPGGVAFAAEPSPTPAASADDRGDMRSAGEGAGFVGAPVVAIGSVLLIGLASAGVTAAYVRLTSDRAGGDGR